MIFIEYANLKNHKYIILKISFSNIINELARCAAPEFAMVIH